MFAIKQSSRCGVATDAAAASAAWMSCTRPVPELTFLGTYLRDACGSRGAMLLFGFDDGVGVIPCASLGITPFSGAPGFLIRSLSLSGIHSVARLICPPLLDGHGPLVCECDGVPLRLVKCRSVTCLLAAPEAVDWSQLEHGVVTCLGKPLAVVAKPVRATARGYLMAVLLEGLFAQ